MEKDNVELAQISFYLAKDEQSFETVIDPEAALNKRRAYRAHDFEAGDAKCRFLYFEQVSGKSNPPWLDFANEKLPAADQIKFVSRSESANGILLINLDGKIFAATFGRSAASCLLSKALEPDFGIKNAMNMCGNEEIRQTKSQSNTITPTHIDRQVAKPSDSFTFGLNEAEDLRYISAHIKGEKNVTLQGRDSLTVKVIGKDKLSWDKLIAQCKKFLTAYVSTEFTKLFPNYKNFKAATDAEAKILDQELIDAMKVEDFHKLNLGIPEFLSEEEYSYSYTNYATKENLIYSFLDPVQLKTCLNLSAVTIDQLKRKKIWAYSPVEDRILSYKKWYIYDCLNFEHKLGDDYFILSDGRWLKIDAEFYRTIEDFTANVLRVEPCEPAYVGIDISNHAKKRNEERIFNDTVCTLRKSAVKFDRAQLRIGTGKSNKEFCDILDLEDDGVVRIVNCKPWKDASSMNYLFSQAKFYCESFLRDETFLADIRNHIGASTSARKADYLAYISDKIEELRGQDYRVCLWLLYDKNDATPSKNDIPLIARYELKLMHEHLRKVCKFRDIIIRFVPVKITNYKTAKAFPRAA
jgi:uncharacterized protein (TIGR04141 family)